MYKYINNKYIRINTIQRYGLTILFLSIVNICLSNTLTNSKIKKDSIRRNAAHYNAMSVNELYNCPFQAKNFAKKALVIAINNNNIEEEARANENFANAAYSLNDTESATFYFKSAMDIYKRTNNYYKVADLNYKIGCIYYNSEEVEVGLKYLEDGVRYAKTSGNKEALCYLYEKISKHYENINNYKKAVQYLLMHTSLKDSIIEEKNRGIIKSLEEKYEKEKNERQFKMLSAENRVQNLQLIKIRGRIYTLLVIALLFLIIAILIINQNKKRIHQRMLVMEQKLLRFQMNPHFIFNALSSIQSMVIKEDKKTAIKQLSNFSELTRFTLNNLKAEFISLEAEITSIEQYLELQKIVLKDKLNCFVDVESSLNLKSTAIPPMLLQPFVENAIIHGIYHKKKTGNIYLRFFKTNNHLQIEIEDDGVGREKAKEYIKSEHNSYATQITKSRLENINNLLSKKASFEIIDLFNHKKRPKGTKVIFKLPIHHI